MPDSTRRAPALNLDSIVKPVNTLSYNLSYKPLSLSIDKSSQYSPEARRDSFLLKKQNPLGVKFQDLNTNGLSLIDKARMDYMVAHPDQIKYVWDEIPDPTKDIREEGRFITRVVSIARLPSCSDLTKRFSRRT